METTPITPQPPVRCSWAGSDPLYCDYHDREWGVPVHDDRLLFEFLLLEGAQAGLSWITILRKREAYRSAFSDFEPETVASFDESKVAQFMDNPGIVRNRLKIHAAITNAKAFLKVQEEFGSFDRYIWDFTGGVTIQSRWENVSELPCSSEESHNMSRDLLKRGFRFVGPVICYSFMQAVGMVNDHTVLCFRQNELTCPSECTDK